MNGLVAVLDKRECKAVAAVSKMMEILAHGKQDAFIIATAKIVETAYSLHHLKCLPHESSVALGHIFYKVLDYDSPQALILKNAAIIISGRTYPKIETLREEDCLKIAEDLIKAYEGAYAFAIAGERLIIIGRDPMGLHPIYYGENDRFFAAASELKALWCLGIKKSRSLPPGNVAIFNGEALSVKSVKTLKEGEEEHKPIEETVKDLKNLLEQSISERTRDLNRAALAFSGGLDSSLIALLLKKAGVETKLIHVSIEGLRGISQAEEAATQLDMPIHMRLYKEEDVERTLPLVLWALEQPDPLKASIGIPVYWTAETAASLGYKVLFAGHGADELFGGYKRYFDIYLRSGREEATKAIITDAIRMYETNFERDYKLCCYNGVELRMPFADYELASFALKLPIELKVSLDSGERKILLRKVAERLGVPPKIVNMPKQAIQYSTGVSKALIRLAKSRKLGVKDYLKKIFDDILLEKLSRDNGET